MGILDGFFGMARAATAMNRVLDGSLGRLMAIDEISRDLESRKPLGQGEFQVKLLGPDGKPVVGGGGRIDPFHMQSTAPGGGIGAGVTGFSPPGTDIRIGQVPPSVQASARNFGQFLGEGRAGSGAPGSEGGEQTLEDVITAIVSSAGVAAPAKDAWDPNGTSDGARGGQVLRFVSENGINSPREYLTWCAGWLAYGNKGAAESVELTAGQVGGGSGPRQWADWAAQNQLSVLSPWIAVNGPRNKAQWKFANPNQVVPPNQIAITGPPNRTSTGDRGGGTVEASLASINRSSKDTVSAVASSGNSIVSAVKELTSVVRAGQSGLTTRAEGAP